MVSELDELRELLAELDASSEVIPYSRLYALSDLTGSKLALFLDAWETCSAVARRRLVQGLVELAETSFEVFFDPIFRLCLEDPDEIIRARAIGGLWENDDISLVGPLLSMLRSDPSPQVRASAATSLGRFVLAGELERLDNPIQARIMTELLTVVHLADESVDVRRRAVEAVAYGCTSEVQTAIELAYYDEDEDMRVSAVVAMGRSCDKRWAGIILDELENPSPAMRYEAAWAAGELAIQRAVPILAGLMDDLDYQVRNASIWALGQIGGAEARDILLAAYDDADEDLEAALDDALAEQALSDGEVDLTLYEVGDDLDDDLAFDEFDLSSTVEDDASDDLD